MTVLPFRPKHTPMYRSSRGPSEGSHRGSHHFGGAGSYNPSSQGAARLRNAAAERLRDSFEAGTLPTQQPSVPPPAPLPSSGTLQAILDHLLDLMGQLDNKPHEAPPSPAPGGPFVWEVKIPKVTNPFPIPEPRDDWGLPDLASVRPGEPLDLGGDANSAAAQVMRHILSPNDWGEMLPFMPDYVFRLTKAAEWGHEQPLQEVLDEGIGRFQGYLADIGIDLQAELSEAAAREILGAFVENIRAGQNSEQALENAVATTTHFS